MESYDMNEEQKPRKKVLFKEGRRIFKIIACSDEVKSKQGNNQYIITIRDMETGQDADIYAVSEPKKRWMLKEILDACGVENQNGVYTFEPPLSKNLVGKEISGFVEHEDNEWINREGETVISKQHRISDFEPTAWDENEK